MQWAEIHAIMPEITLLAMICVFIVFSVCWGQKYSSFNYLFAQLSLLVAILALFKAPVVNSAVLFGGHYVVDTFSHVLKLFILSLGFFAFLYARDYNRDRAIPEGEFYILGLFSLLGMLLLVSSHSMLLLFLGLELLSLPLYALIALHREQALPPEAALKYFILGAIATALLLYGISLIFGVSQTLLTSETARVLAQNTAMSGVVVVGAVLVLSAAAFKLGLVPFHMWVPDVYHGAPTPVVSIVGSMAKIAGFALLMRLVVDVLPAFIDIWQPFLMGLAVLSVALGNVIAIAQTNIKRLLAYSAIAHVGFIVLGVLVGSPAGYAASLFYTLTYGLMSLAAFALLLVLSHAGFDCEKLDDFKGLNQKSPRLAFMAMMILFSLAGVPPLLGFYAKFWVIQALIDQGMSGLAIFAVIFSVIGAFYYLRVIRMVYFEDPLHQDPLPIPARDVTYAFTLHGTSILLLGLFPSFLFTLCQQATIGL